MRGSQLGSQVNKILLLCLGPAAQRQIPVQHAFTVHAVGAEQLDLALVQQLGNGVRHAVVLPVEKAAAAGGRASTGTPALPYTLNSISRFSTLLHSL